MRHPLLCRQPSDRWQLPVRETKLYFDSASLQHLFWANNWNFAASPLTCPLHSFVLMYTACTVFQCTLLFPWPQEACEGIYLARQRLDGQRIATTQTACQKGRGRCRVRSTQKALDLMSKSRVAV